MRAARTRANPTSISLVHENFRPSGLRSSGLTRASSSRAFGPMTDNTPYSADTSVSATCSSGPMWRPIQSASRAACAEPVTMRNRSAAVRITVRSLSMPPRAFSIAV